MKIVKEILTISELRSMAADLFGDMVKAVVDVDKETIALNAELHSDLEALLLKEGSKQNNLWGINLYPKLQGDQFVEFDSMINMRPSKGNRSRGVESEQMRGKILEIIAKRIKT